MLVAIKAAWSEDGTRTAAKAHRLPHTLLAAVTESGIVDANGSIWRSFRFAEADVERKLVAVLAADVVGYSSLMERDEEGTLAALKAHRVDLIDRKIDEHHGRIVKVTGDGTLVEFASLVDAVRCAVEIQNGMARRNADVPRDRRIAFRIGINLGDVIVEGDDIYGDGVNIAARLEALAEPGGITISGTSYEMIQGRLAVPFRDLGLHELKNIARPVRVWAWGEDLLAPGAERPQGRAGKPAIAVLPFTNMSGDAEQEYFADGITEDIITDLSKVSGLLVAARNSVFVYKAKPFNLQQVSRDLNVSYVLEGSVRKAANRVRITAQLIDGESGGHLWADRYDRELVDIFGVQDEIAHSIVDALKVRLLPQESRAIRKVPTTNVEAYQFYLRGRQFLSRHSAKSYEIARRMFVRAIELDPAYAHAHSGIADCDAFRHLNYDFDASLDGIFEASAKALELDPDLAEAHASRGLALSISERHAEAESEFRRALELDPDLFESNYFYAQACVRQGKHDLAATYFGRAAELGPDDFQAVILMGCAYRAIGREADAAVADRRGFERAARELERHPENARAAYFGAAALVSMGEPARARAWAERALWIDPDDFLVLYNIACIHVRLGEHGRALDFLERAMPRAHPELAAWLRNDSDLDPLRDDPRFKALLQASYAPEPEGA
jgi:adenylate cyclase